MQDYADWIESFLKARGLSRANGDMLFAYRATKAEYSSLQALLANTLECLGGAPWTLRSRQECACFVLYASEWWRRAYNGGPWRWTHILQSLGQPFFLDVLERTAAVERGLRAWGHRPGGQGTARIAAQLQQDAERNALRAAVYRRLVLAMSSSGPEQAEIKKRLADNSTVMKVLPPGSPAALTVDKMMRDDEEKLRKLAGGRPVLHAELVQWLATQVPDISQWIHRYYEESDAHFRTGRGKELLTEILLCREFARRPKRQNSLETMGLMAVQYPKLAAIVSRRPAVEQAGMALPEWIDFLKICLDFHVRQSFCLNLPASWERWGGNRVFSKQLLPPSSVERNTSKLLKWPKVRPGVRQHRLVRLLAYVLKVDPQTATGRDRIDSLLLAAWEDLSSTANLLQLGGGQGRYLDLADFAFQTMSKAWVCPVTRRILDVTLRGATPYLPERQMRDDVVLWMLPQGSSRQERFVAWCECFNPEEHRDLNLGISALVKRTVLEGRESNASLVADVGQAAMRHASEWMAELEAIDSQISELSKRADEDRIPLKALQIQRKRLTGEYLLRELATSGFLPGYGFPTDITTFETLNKDSAELTQSRSESGGREDNRYQRRELPSRGTVTALREYAPGASVVIDGLVYESAGITLNWHAPATLDQVNELQNIRQAWRCGHCGSSGTSVLASPLDRCLECGARLTREGNRNKQYLEPAGFSVDLYSETHNDISLQKYVPVEAPWIAAQGDWVPLANPALGAFRCSAEGSVFHFSSGLGGAGYAVCLECGRAAPMGYGEDSEEMPAAFKRPHKRLRGRRGSGDDWNCGGSDSPFKIKKGVSFGREYTTDVLELSLVGLDGHALADADVAYTLAVALRTAIAGRLGVDESELGCDTKPIRDPNGRPSRVIQIFDMRSGGYSSLVAADLPILLRAAREVLTCESNCESACQSCLLTFDTRFRLDSLDRHAALRFLSDEWIHSMQLPDDQQLFGKTSTAEYQPLAEAITRELNRTSAKRLYVYMTGDPSDWDLASSPLRQLLHRLSVKSGVELCLMTPAADLSSLSLGNATTLNSLATICNVKLLVGRPPALTGPGVCLASVEAMDGTCTSWGTSDRALGVPDPRWGVLGALPLVVAPSSAPTRTGAAAKLSPPTSAGARAIEVAGELDGPGQGFGTRFWAAVSPPDLPNGLPVDRSIVSVSYEDRYLVTPLSCALLVELISALKVQFESMDRWDNPEIIVSSMYIDETRQGRHRDQWTSDWPSTELRDAALQSALEYCGLRASITSKAKRDLIHGRRLVIRFDRGPDCTLWMDQGLSYWTVARQQARTSAIVFSAGDEAAALGERLAQVKVGVEGHGLPTQIFLSRRND